MKYLYVFIFLFTYGFCAAQDTELLDKEWFLNEIVINGESFSRTPNVDGSAFFYQDNIHVGHQMCEGAFGGQVAYIGPDTFEIFEAIILLDMGCNEDATAFMNRHYFFYGIEVMPYNNPFNYVIENNGNEKTLTVTNVNGDQAIYGTQPILSVRGFDENSFAVYPNPAKNEIFLSLENNSGKINVKILNVEGKVLSTHNKEAETQTSIDVSNLKTGIYFLSIEGENGNRVVKKFIKE